MSETNQDDQKPETSNKTIDQHEDAAPPRNQQKPPSDGQAIAELGDALGGPA